MGQAQTAARIDIAVTFSQPRAARLFKRDHPRLIDRYIDYFGGTLYDPCGERLLDALEQDAGE